MTDAAALAALNKPPFGGEAACPLAEEAGCASASDVLASAAGAGDEAFASPADLSWFFEPVVLFLPKRVRAGSRNDEFFMTAHATLGVEKIAYRK